MSSMAMESRTLPLFLTKQNKYIVGWPIFLFAAASYLLSNHLHFVPPQELPRTWVDLAVPFMPNSVWIYLSEYLFFSVIYIVATDLTKLNKFIYAFFALQFTSCVVFWVWPTTYPRSLYPLPADLNAITHYAFTSLRETDTPANCCPSLHVSGCFLASFHYLRGQQRKYFPLFFVWAAAIAVSTLTTKQHYLVDVVTGFLTAVAFHWVFHHRLQYKHTLSYGAQAKR